MSQPLDTVGKSKETMLFAKENSDITSNHNHHDDDNDNGNPPSVSYKEDDNADEMRSVLEMRKQSMPTNPYDSTRFPDMSSLVFEAYVQALHDRLTRRDNEALQRFVSTLSHSHCRYDRHARDEMLRFLHNHSMIEEWIHPSPGVVRSVYHESLVPCADGKDESDAGRSWSRWVREGDWYALPMASHCCNHGSSIIRCPGHVKQASPSGSTFDDAPWICPEFVPKKDDCVVFSFGLANQWEFEDYVASQYGCTVHAFDPTTKYKAAHEQHNVPNVTFHYQGLTSKGDDAKASQLMTHYGAMDGEFRSLGDLRRQHLVSSRSVSNGVSNGENVGNSRLSVLKIDCEGCEWEALRWTAEHEPEALDGICLIFVEFHFANTLQMKTAEQLEDMAMFWRHFVEGLGFRFFFLHPNPGAARDRKMNPLLIDLGLDPRICCYEVALYRPGCQ